MSVRNEDRQIAIDAPKPHLRGRTVHWYEKHYALKSRLQMAGVDKLTGRKFYKPLFITGTGRCGTTWLSHTLIKAGFDIPHECVGELGTVSLFLQKDHSWYPFIPWEKGRVVHIGERRSDFIFELTVHLVRHPLEVVASMKSGIIQELSKVWFHEVGLLPVPHNFRPAVYRDLLYYKAAVDHCEDISDMTITLPQIAGKDGDKYWKRMLKAAGLGPAPPMPELPPKNRSTGYKKHNPLTWAEVDALDFRLGKTLRRLCRKMRLE